MNAGRITCPWHTYNYQQSEIFMIKNCRFLLVLIVSISLNNLALAEQNTHHTEHNSEKGQSVTHLSPAIRELLKQEMNSIQKTMAEILPLLISGNWHQVSELAAKIADGHIMKQKLTAEQGQELMATLPQGFKELDNNFHNSASMMSHVAEQGHIELVAFYYYRLTELCITCHGQYAQHRFPKLFLVPKEHSHAEQQAQEHNH